MDGILIVPILVVDKVGVPAAVVVPVLIAGDGLVIVVLDAKGLKVVAAPDGAIIVLLLQQLFDHVGEDHLAHAGVVLPAQLAPVVAAPAPYGTVALQRQGVILTQSHHGIGLGGAVRHDPHIHIAHGGQTGHPDGQSGLAHLVAGDVIIAVHGLDLRCPQCAVLVVIVALIAVMDGVIILLVAVQELLYILIIDGLAQSQLLGSQLRFGGLATIGLVGIGIDGGGEVGLEDIQLTLHLPDSSLLALLGQRQVEVRMVVGLTAVALADGDDILAEAGSHPLARLGLAAAVALKEQVDARLEVHPQLHIILRVVAADVKGLALDHGNGIGPDGDGLLAHHDHHPGIHHAAVAQLTVIVGAGGPHIAIFLQGDEVILAARDADDAGALALLTGVIVHLGGVGEHGYIAVQGKLAPVVGAKCVQLVKVVYCHGLGVFPLNNSLNAIIGISGILLIGGQGICDSDLTLGIDGILRLHIGVVPAGDGGLRLVAVAPPLIAGQVFGRDVGFLLLTGGGGVPGHGGGLADLDILHQTLGGDILVQNRSDRSDPVLFHRGLLGSAPDLLILYLGEEVTLLGAVLKDGPLQLSEAVLLHILLRVDGAILQSGLHCRGGDPPVGIALLGALVLGDSGAEAVSGADGGHIA